MTPRRFGYVQDEAGNYLKAEIKRINTHVSSSSHMEFGLYLHGMRIGYLDIYLKKTTVYINYICNETLYENKVNHLHGVGRLLIQFAFEVSCHFGRGGHLSLFAVDNSNVFYFKLGFVASHGSRYKNILKIFDAYRKDPTVTLKHKIKQHHDYQALFNIIFDDIVSSQIYSIKEEKTNDIKTDLDLINQNDTRSLKLSPAIINFNAICRNTYAFNNHQKLKVLISKGVDLPWMKMHLAPKAIRRKKAARTCAQTMLSFFSPGDRNNHKISVAQALTEKYISSSCGVV